MNQRQVLYKKVSSLRITRLKPNLLTRLSMKVLKAERTLYDKRNELLIEVGRLFERKDLRIKGMISVEYIDSLIKNYPLQKQVKFLTVAKNYLENKIPSNNDFKGISFYLVSLLLEVTGRYQLWTMESIQDVKSLLENSIHRIEQRGNIPVIVEVAAGLGDLSFGLQGEFPMYRVIPTDISTPREIDVSNRGFVELDINKLTSDVVKERLGLTDKDEIILIAANLNLNANHEIKLFSQNISHEVLIVHTEDIKYIRSLTGDDCLRDWKNKGWNLVRYDVEVDSWRTTLHRGMSQPAQNYINYMYRNR